jgi:hypothetical protein
LPFINWTIYSFLVFNSWRSLFILDINPLSDEYLAKIFSHFCKVSLDSGDCFLFCVQAFYFDAILFFSSCFYFLGNWSPIQKAVAHAYVFKWFPCSSLSVLGLLLRSLMHLEVIVQSERQGFSFTLLHVDNQFSQHHSLNVCFWILCWKSDKGSVSLWAYFWIFSFIPLICMSVFVPVFCWFCFYGSVV